MSSKLKTYSKFYFGHMVTQDNNLLDFKEGAGPELTATLRPGEYSLTKFVTEVQRALNDTGALVYVVTVNRTTRLITITTSSNFKLLVSTGSHIGSAPWSLMGFTGSDRTGASTYTGDSVSGQEYKPQFKLQDFISSESYRQSADASVNKSANGQVEVIRFGIEKFTQFKISFSTNITQSSGGPIKNNPTGVSDLENFMRYITTKSPVEFIFDENDPSTFETILLESSGDNSKGVGYKLKELYDKELPGYFETTDLTMRIVE